MIESQVEEEIEVEKFGNAIKVIPAFTGDNEEQSNNIIHKLSSRLEQNIPIYLKRWLHIGKNCKLAFSHSLY